MHITTVRYYKHKEYRRKTFKYIEDFKKYSFKRKYHNIKTYTCIENEISMVKMIHSKTYQFAENIHI